MFDGVKKFIDSSYVVLGIFYFAYEALQRQLIQFNRKFYFCMLTFFPYLVQIFSSFWFQICTILHLQPFLWFLPAEDCHAGGFFCFNYFPCT